MTVFEVDWDAFAAREPDIAAIAVLGAPEPMILVQPRGSDYLAGPMLRARMMDYAGSLDELCIAILGSLPVLADGSVDEAQARTLATGSDLRYRYVPAATPTERAVIAIVERMVPIAHLSLSDDLPSLGADSLLVVELAERLHDAFGLRIEAEQLFALPELGQLARLIDLHRTGRDQLAGSPDTGS